MTYYCEDRGGMHKRLSGYLPASDDRSRVWSLIEVDYTVR